jgi:predicted nucleic acid-binding protein
VSQWWLDLPLSIAAYRTTVRLPPKPPSTPNCHDKFALPFLQLAVIGNADFLVRGDRDLLSIEGKFVCPIPTAEQFIKTLNI